MPYTPYHFGPNGFIGLLFHRWLDLPVFFLANLAVDFEVIVVAYTGRDFGDPRYGHTLLIASAAGMAWGLVAFPLKGVFAGIMGLLRLPYRTGLVRMIYSGLLGAWVHVLVDGLYRSDVVLFWPGTMANPLCRFGKRQVETWCLILSAATVALYISMRLYRALRSSRANPD